MILAAQHYQSLADEADYLFDLLADHLDAIVGGLAAPRLLREAGR